MFTCSFKKKTHTTKLYCCYLRWIIWCCSVTQSCPALCNPVDCSTPAFPVLHHLSRVCSNSCPLSLWCHPAISSSVIPFSSCPQSFPASGSFPLSQFFASGGQKHWSFSFSISPSSENSGLISFRMDWFGFLAVQGPLKSLLQHLIRAI